MIIFNIIVILIYFRLVLVDSVLLCPTQCDCDKEGTLNRARCTDQNIVTIEVGVPIGVQVYSLSNNIISELDNYVFKEAGYTLLVVLNLSYNHIFWIGLHAFAGLTQLTNLDLSNNRLSYLPSDLFWETPYLQHLDLSGNMFENIKNEPFLMHESLKILNMKSCRIKSLPERMFTRLPHLRKLDLSENYMVSMTTELLKPMPKLERIELHNEYWRCTPQLMSVESWIIDKGITYKKNCKKVVPKMFEKMISIEKNFTQINVEDVWNITTPAYVPTNTTRHLSNIEKFNKEFPSIQALILGFEIGLAIGILGTYLCLTNMCRCCNFKFRKLSLPQTRRQRLRQQRMAESDLSSGLLWANMNNTDLETPPPFHRQSRLLLDNMPQSHGLHGIREASDLFDVIRPGRVETPPPPYNECRIQFR